MSFMINQFSYIVEHYLFRFEQDTTLANAPRHVWHHFTEPEYFRQPGEDSDSSAQDSQHCHQANGYLWR